MHIRRAASPLTTLFISDLHLCAERPEVNAAFFHFLQTTAADADALYILGDLFEAWIGDDDSHFLSQQIIRALRTLTDSGTRLYFQHGNRDFAIGKRFARETGCILLSDHVVIELYGKQVLVLHGDTLCSDDIAYQRLRKFIRNPLFLKVMGLLPLKLRQRIALKGRKKSMMANRNKSVSIMDVTPETVKSLMTVYGVNTMIHGHVHRPCCHEVILDDGTVTERIVLGDWDRKGWMIRANDKELKLLSFAL